MSRRVDVLGQRYGRLVVTGEAEPDARGARRVHARCDCGRDAAVVLSSLRTGNTTSCGCLRRETVGNSRRSHGATVGHKTSGWYTSWAQMVQRCTNREHKNYVDYGARGITVCERWLTAANFLADMGDRPDGATLERIRNNEGYGPDNCRWASRKEQGRNQRSNVVVEFRGRSMCFADACELAGVPYHRAYERVFKLRWPLERALGAV